MQSAVIKAKAKIDKNCRVSGGDDNFFGLFGTRHIDDISGLMPDKSRESFRAAVAEGFKAGAGFDREMHDSFKSDSVYRLEELTTYSGETMPFMLCFRGEPPCEIELVNIFGVTKKYRSFNKRLDNLYSAISLASPAAFFEYDPRENRFEISVDRAVKVYDGSLEGLMAFMAKKAVLPKDGERVFAGVLADFKELKAGTYNARMKYNSLEEGYRDVTIHTGVIKDDETIALVGIITDRYFNYALNPSANTNLDPLTGLYNKTTIKAMAESLLKENKQISFLVMDLDRFKEVNDTYGHMAGDQVLYEVSIILREVVKDKGYVGRIGGDEFFIVLVDQTDEENQLRPVMRDIRTDIEQSFEDRLGAIRLTASIGCATSPKDADNYEDLFLLADRALYRAKFKGRNRYVIYFEPYHGSLAEIKAGKKKQDIRPEASSERKIVSITRAIDSLYDHGTEIIVPVLKGLRDIFGADEVNVFSYNGCTVEYATEEEPTMEQAVCRCLRSMAREFKNTDNIYFGDLNMMESVYPNLYIALKAEGVRSVYIQALKQISDIKYFCIITIKGQNYKWSEVDRALLTMLFKTLGTVIFRG